MESYIFFDRDFEKIIFKVFLFPKAEKIFETDHYSHVKKLVILLTTQCLYIMSNIIDHPPGYLKTLF